MKIKKCVNLSFENIFRLLIKISSNKNTEIKNAIEILEVSTNEKSRINL